MNKAISNIYRYGVRSALFFIVIGMIFLFFNHNHFEMYNDFMSLIDIFHSLENLHFYVLIYIGIYLIIITPLIAIFYILIDSLRKNDYSLALLCFFIIIVLGLYLYFS
ncbi:DUF1634 domain-containing protein [Deferribacter thermophilus]|uniref:DUF1634 domain-containing protein n=1 Tax=Deferribacter thermophilus TaxID=53573 RepID=UPI003C1A36D9